MGGVLAGVPQVDPLAGDGDGLGRHAVSVDDRAIEDEKRQFMGGGVARASCSSGACAARTSTTSSIDALRRPVESAFAAAIGMEDHSVDCVGTAVGGRSHFQCSTSQFDIMVNAGDITEQSAREPVVDRGQIQLPLQVGISVTSPHHNTSWATVTNWRRTSSGAADRFLCLVVDRWCFTFPATQLFSAMIAAMVLSEACQPFSRSPRLRMPSASLAWLPAASLSSGRGTPNSMSPPTPAVTAAIATLRSESIECLGSTVVSATRRHRAGVRRNRRGR